jgi:hypothetical protein
VATVATVTGGMSLGFSAVALPAMQTTYHHPHVSEDQASWIGKAARRCSQYDTDDVRLHAAVHSLTLTA